MAISPALDYSQIKVRRFEIPDYRSVSQHNTYNRCPYSYKLGRIDKVWKRPASWLSQGIAVHAAMEAWEASGRILSLDELNKIYVDEYLKSIDEQAQETPNFNEWFGSGPYNGRTDVERRFNVGLDQLASLVQYCTDNPNQKIWITPDGEPAIELEFFVELGGVMVKGFIDQIIETPQGLRVRDIKTGAKPGDIFQLATYAEAMKQKYGVEIEAGDYLMGKAGRPTRAIKITPEDRKEVHKGFADLEKKIQRKEFPANPDRNICTMCDVRTSCDFSAV